MIYLDNAATSFPKPPSVVREVNRCLSSYCGNPGRGSHTLSRRSAEKVYSARENAASFFGSGKPEGVIFTYNDTYALNIALKGILRRGDHVIISDMEHNSVYRPICRMAKDGRITFDVFGTFCRSAQRDTNGIIRSIERLIRPETRLVAVTHASNICSASLPVREIGELCRRHGILFLVDAAQSAGHLPINMEEMNVDLLCAPAHKGLFGIQGCGLLLIRGETELSTLIEGGSGVNSLLTDMPELPPERYEAGTLCVPAIAALDEGLKFVRSVGLDAIREHEEKLYTRALSVLSEMHGIHIYVPHCVGSTLLFNIEGKTPEQVSDLLDRRGICVRSGFHCSPLGHASLGTGENGAVRASFGFFSRQKDVDMLCRALKEIRT